MDTDRPPILNVADAPLQAWSQGGFYAGRDASIGALIGLSQLGISVNEVPPGKSGCPFHNHHVEEELFIITGGQGEYRVGLTRYAVKAGDIVGAPAGGQETAHQLINTGDITLTYFAISTKARTEIVEYPDSGKFLAKTNGEATNFRSIGLNGVSVDYWQDEPGA